MPVRIVAVKRHDKGECDYWTPQVFCDACGEVIGSASDGGCYWKPDYGVTEPAFYAGQYTPVFAHKRCDRHFPAAEGWHWFDLPLFAKWMFGRSPDDRPVL